jgi:hypothetical protein
MGSLALSAAALLMVLPTALLAVLDDMKAVR